MVRRTARVIVVDGRFHIRAFVTIGIVSLSALPATGFGETPLSLGQFAHMVSGAR